MTDHKYHLHIGKRDVGPLHMDQVAKMIEDGTLSLRTPIWVEGEENWVPIADRPELVEVREDEAGESLELMALEPGEGPAPVVTAIEAEEGEEMPMLSLELAEADSTPARPPVVPAELADDEMEFVDADAILESLELPPVEAEAAPVVSAQTTSLDDDGENTEDHAIHCPRCGTVFLYCPYCGEALSDHDPHF